MVFSIEVAAYDRPAVAYEVQLKRPISSWRGRTTQIGGEPHYKCAASKFLIRSIAGVAERHICRGSLLV
jgi:hypothetical protein